MAGTTGGGAKPPKAIGGIDAERVRERERLRRPERERLRDLRLKLAELVGSGSAAFSSGASYVDGDRDLLRDCMEVVIVNAGGGLPWMVLATRPVILISSSESSGFTANYISFHAKHCRTSSYIQNVFF